MIDKRAFDALLWVGLPMGVFSTYFFFTSSMDPFNLPKSIMIMATGIALIFALGGLWGRVEKKRLLATLPFLAIAIWMSIAGPLGTSDSHRLLFGAGSRATGLLSYLGMIVIAISLVIATRGPRMTALYASLVAVTLFEAGYGFLQFLRIDPVSWNNPYNRIIGSLGNPNFMSATLGFCGVALVSLFFNAQHKWWMRYTGGFLGIAAFLLALATDSVQGPIAFAGGLAFVLGVVLWTWKGKSPLFYGYATVAGAVLVTVLLGVAKIGPFADKLYQYTLGVRTQYWRAALKMMGNSPLFGVGVDSFGENYRLVRDAETFKVLSPITITNAAHSVPLQLGATLGIPMLILYLALQVFTAYRAYILVRSSAQYRVGIAGIIGAWLAFQAQSFISIDQLGVAVWGWILGASLIGASFTVSQTEEVKTKKQKRNQQSSRVGIVASLGAFGLIIGLALSWQSYSMDLSLRQALAIPFDANNSATFPVKLAALTEAADNVRGDVPFSIQVLSDMAKIPGARDQTIKLIERIAREHPESWDAQNYAADIFENTNQKDKAIPYRIKQISLDPANWQPILTLAKDYEALGKKSEARAAYQEVISMAPKSVEGVSAKDALAKLG
jgi:O-antigen ligase